MRLRGTSYTMMVLRLADAARPGFLERLRAKLSQAPSFFDGVPVVVDLAGTHGGSPADFAALANVLRELRLRPVGAQGGDDAQHQAAIGAGLAVFPAWSAGGRSETEVQPHRPPPAPPERRPTLLVEGPVRSGQQVYADGRDLVVLGAVGAGAELLADGHIHVYAALRGRALAGVSGDEAARIFCGRMQAELLSVAGRYRIAEEIAEAVTGRPVQVRLDRGELRIDPLDG